MDDKERLHLQEMINSYDAEDNTSKIRKLKHSKFIKNDIEQFINLKKKYQRLIIINPKKFESIVCKHCSFLFTKYTNIYNRLVKDELDLRILLTFVETLKDVENENIDQHEASVKIGKILKKLYIDSALKREEKTNLKEKKTKKKFKTPINNISWAKFKQSGLNLE
jgi:hypothetical protein